MIQILKDHANDVRLGPVIAATLDLIHSTPVESDPEPVLHPQSSKWIAELHDFRRRSGYYRAGGVTGLDETIPALSKNDIPVKWGLIETSKCFVPVYLNEQDALLGVLVFRRISIVR